MNVEMSQAKSSAIFVAFILLLDVQAQMQSKLFVSITCRHAVMMIRSKQEYDTPGLSLLVDITLSIAKMESWVYMHEL